MCIFWKNIFSDLQICPCSSIGTENFYTPLEIIIKWLRSLVDIHTHLSVCVFCIMKNGPGIVVCFICRARKLLTSAQKCCVFRQLFWMNMENCYASFTIQTHICVCVWVYYDEETFEKNNSNIRFLILYTIWGDGKLSLLSLYRLLLLACDDISIPSYFAMQFATVCTLHTHIHIYILTVYNIQKCVHVYILNEIYIIWAQFSSGRLFSYQSSLSDRNDLFTEWFRCVLSTTTQNSFCCLAFAVCIWSFRESVLLLDFHLIPIFFIFEVILVFFLDFSK